MSGQPLRAQHIPAPSWFASGSPGHRSSEIPFAPGLCSAAASRSTPARPGLIVVGVSDMGARVEEAMKHAEKIEKKELKADNEAIEADAESAS